MKRKIAKCVALVSVIVFLVLAVGCIGGIERETLDLGGGFIEAVIFMVFAGISAYTLNILED